MCGAKAEGVGNLEPSLRVDDHVHGAGAQVEKHPRDGRVAVHAAEVLAQGVQVVMDGRHVERALQKRNQPGHGLESDAHTALRQRVERGLAFHVGVGRGEQFKECRLVGLFMRHHHKMLAVHQNVHRAEVVEQGRVVVDGVFHRLERRCSPFVERDFSPGERVGFVPVVQRVGNAPGFHLQLQRPQLGALDVYVLRDVGHGVLVWLVTTKLRIICDKCLTKSVLLIKFALNIPITIL